MPAETVAPRAERRKPQNAALRVMHDDLQRRYERFARRMLVAVSVIGIATIAGLVAEGFIISGLHREIDHRQQSIKTLIAQIQRSRIQAIVSRCEQENGQNRAIRALIPSTYLPRPGKALSTVRNCTAYARDQAATP